MNQKGYAIAIDGPVAAGKGTVAGKLAEKLHGFHLNTGAMYRCLALYCIEHYVDATSKQAVIQALHKTWFDLTDSSVKLNDVDVTQRIKERDVTTLVPIVAAIGEVRSEMVKRQREIGLKMIEKGKIVLTEGRDVATKIFPDAKLKVFLTARPEVRARRRFEQMGGDRNSKVSFQDILADTKDRDYKDIHRKESPLVSDPKAYGYFLVDDSDQTEDATIAAVLQEIERIDHDTH